MKDDDRPNAFALVAAYLLPVWMFVMMVGLYAAAFGWRPGAYFMITAPVGNIVSHMVMGVTNIGE